MHLLKTVYFWFCQHCETTERTHRGEANLPVDSRSGGRLSNTTEGPLYFPHILAYSQPGERFVIDTDASNVGIGDVLLQIQHYSKTLNKAERNYCTSRRELLAIMRTLEHFHKYFYGQEFHLHTDHLALTWPMSFKNLEGQTARWIQRLQEYNFTSEHH
jgi:hypothetical protein